ncbi:hypothetical protein [Rahnella aceris]
MAAFKKPEKISRYIKGWIETVSVSQERLSRGLSRRNRPEGKSFSPLNSPRFFKQVIRTQAMFQETLRQAGDLAAQRRDFAAITAADET